MFTIRKWSKLGILTLMCCFALYVVVFAATVDKDTQAPTVSSAPGKTESKVSKTPLPTPSPTTNVKGLCNLPVPLSGCCGIGIECGEHPDSGKGVMYYTNSFDPNLHVFNGKYCTKIPSIPLDCDISFGAIAWDPDRKVLWAGTDNSGTPVKVYTIGVGMFPGPKGMPAGHCELQFTLCPHPEEYGFCDGISYDYLNNQIYVSDDVGDWIEVWDVGAADLPAPAYHHTFTVPGGFVSGIQVAYAGTDVRLYVGRNGLNDIIVVDPPVVPPVALCSDLPAGSGDASIGATLIKFLDFPDPGFYFRVEDLTCDDINFPGEYVLWARHAYDYLPGSKTPLAAWVNIHPGPNYPVCNCTTPTLTQWGLIFFGFLLLSYLTYFLYRKRKLTTPTALGIFLLVFTIAFYFSYTV